MILAAGMAHVKPLVVTIVPKAVWWQPGTWDAPTLVAWVSLLLSAASLLVVWRYSRKTLASSRATESLLGEQRDIQNRQVELMDGLAEAIRRLQAVAKSTDVHVETLAIVAEIEALEQSTQALQEVAAALDEASRLTTPIYAQNTAWQLASGKVQSAMPKLAVLSGSTPDETLQAVRTAEASLTRVRQEEFGKGQAHGFGQPSANRQRAKEAISEACSKLDVATKNTKETLSTLKERLRQLAIAAGQRAVDAMGHAPPP